MTFSRAKKSKSPAPHPKKTLGQHWLTRPELAREIAHTLRDVERHPDWQLVEVGPGPGILTRWLVDMPFAQVHLVEKDTALAADLTARFAGQHRVVVHEADILTWDWPDGFTGCVAGNLPYYLTGKFMRGLFSRMGPVDQAVLLVQKEVAQRLTAPLGSRQRGRATVLFEAVCQPRLTRVVKPGAFHPPPKVDSAVLWLKALPTDQSPPAPVRAALERVVDCAFSQRRKVALNLMRQQLPLSPADQQRFVTEFAPLAGLRAEAIATADFLEMARWLNQQEAP